MAGPACATAGGGLCSWCRASAVTATAQRRVGRMHAVIPVPVRVPWRYQRGNALNQFQRREVQLV